MKNTSVLELTLALPGCKIVQVDAEGFSGIGTDTRQNLSQQLFWALRGENFDAHQFLQQAIAQGAKGLLVDHLPKGWQKWAGATTILQVDDTLQALQQFGRAVRRKAKAKVIGITGSNGKTSTKEFAATILQSQYKVHWNRGSFNNHFGLPFNLIATPEESDFVVAEMGMNHAGELKLLCEIAEPDLVVCTVVGRAHIEFFGSEEKIAAAKEEIYLFSPPEALRIYNLDNPWTKAMCDRAPSKGRRLTFSQFDEQADVCLKLRETSTRGLVLQGRIQSQIGECRVPVLGSHHAVNLAAAASLALGAGMSPAAIWQALPSCQGAWGRMQLLESNSGYGIVFDGYNANPDSMAALLRASVELRPEGKTYFVLAEMRELGAHSAEAHEALGRQVAELDPAGIWFYGPSFAHFQCGAESAGYKKNLVVSDSYKEVLASEFASVLKNSDLVFVKGSRGLKTEKFVEVCRPRHFSLDKEGSPRKKDS